MTNEFLEFASDPGSNVMSQEDYEASARREGGVLSGLADPTLYNKAQRQSSFFAALLAQVVADTLGVDVLDDADFAGKLQDLKNAVHNAGALLDKDDDYTAARADTGRLIRFTVTAKTLSLDEAGALGGGWWCIFRSAAGVLSTITTTGSGDAINGLASIKVAGNGVVLVLCDGASSFRAFWLDMPTERVDVASAGTIDVRRDVIGSSYVRITGTTTITGITQNAGAVTEAVFASALQLTPGAGLVVPTAANYQVQAGDNARIIGDPSNVTRVTVQRASGGAPLGSLIRETVLTSSGSYTKPTDASFVEVVCIGGGGGGGTALTNAGANASGGGGGGYAKKRIAVTALTASETVTIGAAGAAGTTSGAAGTGGTTSFGAHVSALGGVGGNGSNSATAPRIGGAGGIPTTGDINVQGAPGGSSVGGANGFSGNGGAAAMGYGMGAVAFAGGANNEGNAGQNYGSGGAGATYQSGATRNGGAGASGAVVVREYS